MEYISCQSSRVSTIFSSLYHAIQRSNANYDLGRSGSWRSCWTGRYYKDASDHWNLPSSRRQTSFSTPRYGGGTVSSSSVSIHTIPYNDFLQRTARSIMLAVTKCSPTDSYVIENESDLFWFRRYDVPERPPAHFLSRIPLSFMPKLNPDEELLAAKEPKLPRFDFPYYPVKYNDFLGNGKEGVVVAATIRGKKYAIKIV